MAPSAVKLRADFELTCFTYEGIDALKAALLVSKAKTNLLHADIQVSYKLIAPPHYRVETVTLRKVEGLAVLEQALKEVETVIKEKGGTFKVVNKPQIIGDSAKDKDLDEIMKMPGEHDSNDGSSDEEDNDEGMGDIDLGEEELTGEAGLEEEDGEEGGEERKVSSKKAKGTKKKSKKAAASDDEEDDA